VLIGVSNDGSGIDAQAVRNRVVEKGLVASDAALTEAETFALIFHPVFPPPNRSPMSPAWAWEGVPKRNESRANSHLNSGGTGENASVRRCTT
jgi:hypothetical protein